MQTALALRLPTPWVPTISPTVDEETKAGMDAIHEAGKNDNTDRGHRQDLKYLRGWLDVARGEPWELPLAVGTVLAFVTFHLAPNPVLDARLVAAGIKAKPGPHSLSTIRRRLATLSVAHKGLADKRRQLMQAWGRYCDRAAPAKGQANVVRIGAKGRTRA